MNNLMTSSMNRSRSLILIASFLFLSGSCWATEKKESHLLRTSHLNAAQQLIVASPNTANNEKGNLEQTSSEGLLLKNKNGVWMDQNGKSFTLDRYKGTALLVFVGYTSCPTLCPMITGQMKKLEEVLDGKKISTDHLQILFITIDEQDTPENLLQYAEKHHLDLKRWTLAQTSKPTKNQFIHALNLNYDETKSNNHRRHSFSLVLIDRNGQLAHTFPNILKLEATALSLALKNFK